MGRKRKAPGEKSCHTRPENAASAQELYAKDHERYHNQNAALQLDMGSLATVLLGLQVPIVSGLVFDLGCGSGLSAAALGRQAGVGSWIGTDITPEMVRLAAASHGAGSVTVSDFGQGLPLRAACLDGAISVSAVQWLCSAADPPASIRRFFGGLHRSLCPGARAALQIYPADDAQAQQLVAGARQCGLDAGLFVAFPHSTPAKKYYLLAQRPQHATQAQHDQGAALPAGGALLSARCCNLAWPKTGGCVLAWVRHLPPQCSPEGLERLASVASRMQQEHASMGKRLVRPLRRTVALTEPAGSAADAGSGERGVGGSAGSSAGSSAGNSEAAQQGAAGPGAANCSLAVHAEFEAQHGGLLPCGGAIFVQLTAAPEVLSAAGGQRQAAEAEPGEPTGVLPDSSAEAGAAAAQGVAVQAGSECRQHAGAAEAAARWLLGGAAPADGASTAGPASSGAPAAADAVHMRQVMLKFASPEDAALHARQQAGQLFQPPPADGGCGAAAKALRFMRLEPLEELQQAGLAAAVVHARKMAQHLALRLSCRTTPGGGGCRRCAGGGGAFSAGGCEEACPPCRARCMAALCAELNGCVVGLDAHLLPSRVDATWVLFLPGLQQLGRDELAAAVLRHLGPPA